MKKTCPLSVKARRRERERRDKRCASEVIDRCWAIARGKRMRMRRSESKKKQQVEEQGERRREVLLLGHFSKCMWPTDGLSCCPSPLAHQRTILCTYLYSKTSCCWFRLPVSRYGMPLRWVSEWVSEWVPNCMWCVQDLSFAHIGACCGGLASELFILEFVDQGFVCFLWHFFFWLAHWNAS
jgi:hypothetical protein